jgi:DNA polymerase/3'-5' exonuclease PolX
MAFSRRLRAIAKSKGYKLNEYALFDLKTGKEIHPKSKDELFKLLDITEGDI